MDSREAILRKVRAMLDKADSTTFEAEADSFRKKADDLMIAWTIEDFELEQAGVKAASPPVLKEYEYGQTGDTDFDDALADLFYRVAKFCGVRIGWYGWRRSRIVGYQADLDYLDMLYTSLRIQMSAKMLPKWDHAMTEGENLAVLKEAGMKWEQIHQLQSPGVPWERRIGVRYTSVYRKYCEETGRQRMLSNPKAWKRDFVEAYVMQLGSRMTNIRRAQDAEWDSKALVLVDRKSALDEALYDAFPDLRPHPDNCDCDRCHTCLDPSCKRRNCVARRKPLKYRKTKEKFVDYAAVRAGQSAADQADLGQTGVSGVRGEL